MKIIKTNCARCTPFGFNKFAGLHILFAALFSLPLMLSAQNNGAAGNVSGAPDSLKGITIHQEITFKASTKQLYDILLSSKQFSGCTKKSFKNFTATSANIDATAGGAFSLFDGVITGRILELVPNERIVEAWRVANWPPGIYSIARFELTLQDSGTKIIFDHTGFPEGLKAPIARGWKEHYWGALAAYLQ
jgi:activator of HSP90 ATPase